MVIAIGVTHVGDTRRVCPRAHHLINLFNWLVIAGHAHAHHRRFELLGGRTRHQRSVKVRRLLAMRRTGALGCQVAALALLCDPYLDTGTATVWQTTPKQCAAI